LAFRSAHGRAPGLHVVLVGDDQASAVYVRNKRKGRRRSGHAGKVFRLPASTSEKELLALVSELNADDTVTAFWCSFRCLRRSAKRA